MNKEIEFKIGTDGKIDMELLGFHGDGCSKESKKISDRLGKVTDSSKKSEYYDGTCNNENTGHERHGY